MLKKIFLVLIISILMLSISGCTDEVAEETPVTDDTTNATITVDNVPEGSGSAALVPADALPDGYEFLGSRELSVEKVGNDYLPVSGIVGGTEGLYTYQGSTDVYVDVIELNSTASAEGFIAEYRESFSSLRSGDRFTDVIVNGHSAVRILEYATIDTNDVERYTYIWNNGRFVFVVGGATADYTVLSTVAEATGY